MEPQINADGRRSGAVEPAPSRRWQRWRSVFRTGLAVVLGALLLEGLCWAVRDLVLPPKWSKNPETDRMEPGFAGTIDYADTVEGRGARLGQLHVNSLGLRGLEPRVPNERSAERLRVYCLGSSTTFGWGASSDEATFPAQLEQILKERFPERQIDVVNAGVPGNNSGAELRILKEDLPRLKPDIVILWSGWPDWTHYLQPEGRSRQSGRDGLEPLRKTNAYRLAEYIRDGLTPRPQPPAFDTFVTRPPLPKFRATVLAKWRGNLEKMIAACSEQQVQVALIGLASPLRSAVDTWDASTQQQASNRLLTLKDAAPSDLPRSIAEFEAVLKDLQRSPDVIYIPGGELPTSAELYFDGVHMRDAGYRALADKIAVRLINVLCAK